LKELQLYFIIDDIFEIQLRKEIEMDSENDKRKL